jgi:hypothetical protein
MYSLKVQLLKSFPTVPHALYIFWMGGIGVPIRVHHSGDVRDPLECFRDKCVDLFIYFYMNKSSIIFKPKFWNLSSWQCYLYQNTEVLPSVTDKGD